MSPSTLISPQISQRENEKKWAPHLSLAQKWLGIAIASLILAGLFSLVLVAGRAPGINQIIQDPQWAKKCLVIHVNLALGVWFYSFLSSLFQMIPGRKSSQIPYFLALAGIFFFAIWSFFIEATPVICNYVPVLDHRIFLGGLFLFWGAIALGFVGNRLWNRENISVQGGFSFLPEAACSGLRTAVLAYWISMSIFVASYLLTPQGLFPHTQYEILFWGGGHLLQFANMAGMTSVWIILASHLLDRPVLSKTGGRFIYSFLLIPVLLSPLLLSQGVTSHIYYMGFTELMRWGIWPGISLLILWIFKSIIQAFSRKELKSFQLQDPSFSGLLSSMVLTLTGFTLGAMISTSSTLIPAHYHAAIGAVTVAYMSATYLLLEAFGKPLSSSLKKKAFYQPLLFGTGQLIFALGFGYAGLHGLGRKVYGQEQHIRSVEEYIGLSIMGIGGVLAISGGILFLFIVGKCWYQKTTL